MASPPPPKEAPMTQVKEEVKSGAWIVAVARCTPSGATACCPRWSRSNGRPTEGAWGFEGGDGGTDKGKTAEGGAS